MRHCVRRVLCPCSGTSTYSAPGSHGFEKQARQGGLCSFLAASFFPSPPWPQSRFLRPCRPALFRMLTGWWLRARRTLKLTLVVAIKRTRWPSATTPRYGPLRGLAAPGPFHFARVCLSGRRRSNGWPPWVCPTPLPQFRDAMNATGVPVYFSLCGAWSLFSMCCIGPELLRVHGRTCALCVLGRLGGVVRPA